MVQNLLQSGRPRLDSCIWKIPQRKEWQPTPVFLPGEFHGQRSLVGYSSWGYKESKLTKRLLHTRILQCRYWKLRRRDRLLLQINLISIIHFSTHPIKTYLLRLGAFIYLSCFSGAFNLLKYTVIIFKNCFPHAFSDTHYAWPLGSESDRNHIPG